jgi:hypothetical protein
MINLLLAICLQPPLLDMSGPECVGSAQLEECRCSEGMRWDRPPAQPDGSEARWYEVWREPSWLPGAEVLVGDTRWRNHPAACCDAFGCGGLQNGSCPLGFDLVPEIHGTFWLFAWDQPFPVEGSTYYYHVRSCNMVGCSVFSPWVGYTAAPYRCYSGGVEVGC